MLRVLIVDDCRDGADTLGALLRLWGHDVQVAYDGPAALRLAEDFRPEALLLDIGLPGMDGCSLARQLRDQPPFREALVIAISGYTDAVHRARGDEAGFDHYLIKPMEPAALQVMLDRWVAEKRPAEGLG
jgi:CheY-like chemotaxis protein